MNSAWYLDRAAGLVLVVLFTLTVALGVITSRRREPASQVRLFTQDLHTRVTVAAMTLLLVHVGTAVVDSYVNISLRDVFVPFIAGWNPLWLGFGTLALDLLLVVVITTIIRHQIGEKPWRSIHLVSYACWALAVIHGWRSGTDTSTVWGLSVIIGCTLIGLGAIAWRISVVLSGRNSLGYPTVAGHKATKGEVHLS
ncbi:MAG TPA: ferric reductase [Actinobacteria bacterium]|nr:ferric reductase [Actinomycetota bacterium]HCK79792.1 ferric reductase [Actinomycetota bacterium]